MKQVFVSIVLTQFEVAHDSYIAGNESITRSCLQALATKKYVQGLVVTHFTLHQHIQLSSTLIVNALITHLMSVLFSISSFLIDAVIINYSRGIREAMCAYVLKKLQYPFELLRHVSL